MYHIDLYFVKKLAPAAKGEYLAAFLDCDSVLSQYKIDSPLRICHFFAQILAETGGFRVFEERLDYSASRLMAVWPKHFHTISDTLPYAHNEQALGNFIYGPTCHPDLGNSLPGDGFKFRGRGFLQITGRAAYTRFGAGLKVGFADHPELVYDHRYSLSVAAAEFVASKHAGQTALEWSDADDIVSVTYAVNGGQNGIDLRRHYLDLAKQKFHAQADAAGVAGATGGSSRSIANVGRAVPA